MRYAISTALPCTALKSCDPGPDSPEQKHAVSARLSLSIPSPRQVSKTRDAAGDGTSSWERVMTAGACRRWESCKVGVHHGSRNSSSSSPGAVSASLVVTKIELTRNLLTTVKANSK